MRSRFVRSLAVSLVAGSMSLGLVLPLNADAMGEDVQPVDWPGADLVVPTHVVHQRQSCSTTVTAGHARCYAMVNLDAQPARQPRFAAGAATAPHSGFASADLQSAYNLNAPSGKPGSGPTVAIVDAYDDPNVEADLGVYRSAYGLGDCTSANGCFTKVNQAGQTSPLSSADTTGWAEEISLDVDMVSAICPNCKIVLVEANSSSFNDLFTAEDSAARLKPASISNSYGGSEFSGIASYQSHYNHPGIAITVSSGDSGYGVEFPASSQYVTAVGGTSLARASTSRGWAESAWSGAGAGCSRYIAKPSWQHDTGCAKRTVADVSAVADPNTGVAVYNTWNGDPGWMVFGGTSVASPIVASVYALASNTASLTYGSFGYSHLSGLFDIRTGSDGRCFTRYLCNAGTGYDGPTGNGTPNGLTAF